MNFYTQIHYYKNIVLDGQTKAWQTGYSVQPVEPRPNGFPAYGTHDNDDD